MSKTEDTTPKEMLKTIYDNIEGIKNNAQEKTLPSQARFKPGKNSVAYNLLKTIDKNPGNTSGELEDKTTEKNSNVTRSLTNMYNAYLIDREDTSAGYIYRINRLGKGVLDEIDQQSELADTQEIETTNPWDDLDGIAENSWKTLNAVNDHEGHPRSKDLETVLNSNGIKHSGSNIPAASPYLSKLFKSGYVDRTPTQPYRYWLSEKGHDAVEQT